jgi:hypothetical protein
VIITISDKILSIRLKPLVLKRFKYLPKILQRLNADILNTDYPVFIHQFSNFLYGETKPGFAPKNSVSLKFQPCSIRFTLLYYLMPDVYCSAYSASGIKPPDRNISAAL